MKSVSLVQMAMKSGRSGSRQQRQQQQQQHHPQRIKDDDHHDDDEELEKSEDSIDSPPDPRSPHCLSRDEVLSSLGYRSAGKLQQPVTQSKQGERTNACRRCGKKVYPLELIDIGDCYHRGCFKCYVSTSVMSCFIM